MEDFTVSVAKRIVAKYNNHIQELESIHEENKSFVEQANKNPDHPDIKMWSEWASAIAKQLEELKMLRNFWQEKYIDKIHGQ